MAGRDVALRRPESGSQLDHCQQIQRESAVVLLTMADRAHVAARRPYHSKLQRRSLGYFMAGMSDGD